MENTDKIIITKPIQLNTTSLTAHLDARSFVETELEIYDIESPTEGLAIYVKESHKTFVVTEVAPVFIGEVFVGNKVSEYKPLQGVILNYRGEFSDGNGPDDAVDGDWYRDNSFGRTQIMQDGSWYTMSQDGVQGPQGVPGKDGTSINVAGSYETVDLLINEHPNGDGTNCYIVGSDLYVWNGSQWTNVGQFRGDKGDKGEKGDKGDTGVGVKNITEYYLASSKSTGITVAGNTWSESFQTVDASKPYLWNYEKIVYTDKSYFETTPQVIGTYSANGQDGVNGADGVGIEDITEYYQVTSDNLTPTSWLTTPPKLTSHNKYLWNYEQITYTDGNTSTTTPMIIGVYGDKGEKGDLGEKGDAGTSISVRGSLNSADELPTPPNDPSDCYVIQTDLYVWDGLAWINVGPFRGQDGADGADGASQYIHIKYANSSTENDWTNDNGETPGAYMGIYADDVKEDLLVWDLYRWSKIKGEPGSPGKNGKDGIGIGEITEYYLATSESDGITTSTSGWSTSLLTLSKDKKYLWNYEMVVFSDGNVTKSTPQVIGMYSADGVGIKSITEYYAISTTNTTYPELNSDDWKTTAPLMTSVYKYLWNYEEIVYTNGTSTNTLPAVIGVYGDTGLQGPAGPQGPLGPVGANGSAGVSSIIIDLPEENVTIPCYANGTLMPGSHFGNGAGESFGSYIYVEPRVYYGTTDVTSECTWEFIGDDAFGGETANYNGEYLLIEDSSAPWVCTIAKISADSKSGRVTAIATYGDTSLTTTFTVAKAYQGPQGVPGTDGNDATFVYHEILPSVTSIVAQLASDGTISNVSPGSIGVDIREVTELGTSVISTLSNAYIYVTAWTYEESVSDDYTYDVSSSAAPEINLLDWWGNETPAYIEVSLWLGAPMFGGVRLDFERIPVIYKPQVSADIPDWVSEWDGDSATINNDTVLTGKLYAGSKPYDGQENWSGLLIGSNVASVEGLPFEGYESATDFSGILAVSNFDTNPGDNYFGPDGNAEVTFALDATTGNAYFKGEVHATTGTFDNGTITNSVIQNLTVGGGSDLYTVSIGNTDYVGDYNSIFSIKTTTGIYDPIVNIACDYDGTTGYLLISRNRADSSGYFSKTIVSGGEFSVHYSKSLSFSNSDSYNTSCIGISQADGIFDSHLGNLTFSLRGNALEFYNYQTNPHYIIVPRLPKMSNCYIVGALCVDDDGVVRVSNGSGGYQYGYGS